MCAKNLQKSPNLVTLLSDEFSPFDIPNKCQCARVASKQYQFTTNAAFRENYIDKNDL